jgi:hypothetical protein
VRAVLECCIFRYCILTIASVVTKQIISLLENPPAAELEAEIVPAVAPITPDNVFAMLWALLTKVLFAAGKQLDDD